MVGGGGEEGDGLEIFEKWKFWSKKVCRSPAFFVFLPAHW